MTADDTRKLADVSYQLLLPTIKRWIKIEMGREQNVAEHSFNVLILSLSLYDFMQQEVPHNSFDRMSIVEWAIVHDLDEIETGDIPADFKNAVRAVCGEEAVDKAVDNIMATKSPTFVSKKRGVKDSYPHDVVKIADKLEEVLFNHKYGRDARAEAAQIDALPLLRSRLLKGEKAHPRYDWERAREWLAYFLYPTYQHVPARQGKLSMGELLAPAPTA